MYLLLSSAKNEEKYIASTIESIAAQSVRPAVWVIIDDGSTDGTVAILRRKAAHYPWIRVLQRQADPARSFHSQYAAVAEAYETVRHEAVEYVGKVDADLIFPSPDYFRQLIAEMKGNERLGLSGGWILEGEGSDFRPRPFNTTRSVPGGVQFFRKKVFDQIGGYHPLKYGGADTLAELAARAAGYEVYSLPELAVHHHRQTGGFDGAVRSAWRWGKRDAQFGGRLSFVALKCARRFFRQPVVSAVWLLGFCAFRLAGEKVVVPEEISRHLRREQRELVVQAFGIRPAAGVSAPPAVL